MKWRNREGSGNVEDQRGGGRGMKMGAGLGIGTVIIVIIALLTGNDPTQLLQQVNQAPVTEQQANGACVFGAISLGLFLRHGGIGRAAKVHQAGQSFEHHAGFLGTGAA